MGKKPARITRFEPTDKKGKKAAIYIRVSSNEFRLTRKEVAELKREQKAAGLSANSQSDPIQDKVRESVATQIEDAIQYCQQQNPPWPYEIYKDNELSGTLDIEERPDLSRLVKDIVDGKIHTLIVRDIKRLTRNSRVLKRIIGDFLIPYGVGLKGLIDGTEISSANSRFALFILGEIAELEVAYMRETSMRNKEQAAINGDLAHGTSTYGYESSGKGKVRVIPEEAKIVKKIFHDYGVRKLSCQDIGDLLTIQKAPTRKGSGIWSGARIYAIIHNPRYIGKMNYLDRKLLRSDVFPPIISQSLWDKAQIELQRRQIVGPRTQNSPHLLTGLLKCSFCIERQKKDSSVKPNMFSKIGGDVRYYACQSRHRRGKRTCLGITVNAGKIETFIEKFVGALAAEEFYNFISDQPAERDRVSERINTLRTLIQEKQKILDQLPSRIARQIISIDMGGRIEKELKGEINIRNKELELAELDLEKVAKAEQLAALDKLRKWKTFTIHEKRAALKKVILEMVLYPDKLSITLRARPDQTILIPYTSYKKNRKKPDFPDVTDGLAIQEKNQRLVIRVGAEFATMDARRIRMHIDPVELPNRISDEEVWQNMLKHPELLDDD